MIRIPTAILVAVVTAFGVATPSFTEPPPPIRTVLVELFTSQGCSSCPPADRLLSRLALDGVDEVQVLPLSFHVDYWNSIGWRDPFSSAEWSQRQRRYANLLRSGVYTPQLVINGRSECVGSQEKEVRQLILQAAERDPGVTLSIHTVDSAGSGEMNREMRVTARLDADVETAAELLLAVIETGLETPVSTGENARKTLHNDNVVRRLTKLAKLQPGQQSELRTVVSIEPDWQIGRLGVVLFAQSPITGEVYGATAAQL